MNIWHVGLSFIAYGIVLLWILNDGAKMRRELRLLRTLVMGYRGEATGTRTELADLAKTAAEAHRRCTEALKSKSEHEGRIRELYERCNSLQAQINVANRAAEHTRGVR